MKAVDVGGDGEEEGSDGEDARAWEESGRMMELGPAAICGSRRMDAAAPMAARGG